MCYLYFSGIFRGWQYAVASRLESPKNERSLLFLILCMQSVYYVAHYATPRLYD